MVGPKDEDTHKKGKMEEKGCCNGKRLVKACVFTHTKGYTIAMRVVVYFEWQITASHTVRWSKSSFWHFNIFFHFFHDKQGKKNKKCKKLK